MKSSIDWLRIIGGKHFLCSPDLVVIAGSIATQKEIDIESDQLIVILFSELFFTCNEWVSNLRRLPPFSRGRPAANARLRQT